MGVLFCYHGSQFLVYSIVLVSCSSSWSYSSINAESDFQDGNSKDCNRCCSWCWLSITDVLVSQLPFPMSVRVSWTFSWLSFASFCCLRWRLICISRHLKRERERRRPKSPAWSRLAICVRLRVSCKIMLASRSSSFTFSSSRPIGKSSSTPSVENFAIYHTITMAWILAINSSEIFVKGPGVWFKRSAPSSISCSWWWHYKHRLLSRDYLSSPAVHIQLTFNLLIVTTNRHHLAVKQLMI